MAFQLRQYCCWFSEKKEFLHVRFEKAIFYSFCMLEQMRELSPTAAQWHNKFSLFDILIHTCIVFLTFPNVLNGSWILFKFPPICFSVFCFLPEQTVKVDLSLDLANIPNLYSHQANVDVWSSTHQYLPYILSSPLLWASHIPLVACPWVYGNNHHTEHKSAKWMSTYQLMECACTCNCLGYICYCSNLSWSILEHVQGYNQYHSQ